ncbi:hypothetical protein [Allochromatium vinosum]|uniref:Uncharacterized protein n=1 Tax=Allochromatium vinosum (strain ATCC 17899 / DSM 180 / NBRC 103801 / NCIMB 10441 / D) TaxID=572477 RepID=D3RQ02_ALLVD|nr:hypothetical protein [Allochromatium vinosum]ADC63613.1 conserved hypothetical protein [Allochromatium vinosum DSM 180]
MSSYFVREVFFRPDTEYARELTTIPAPIHNALRRLLKQARGSSVFVPIRAMQYLAVIDAEEVIFVDAQGGYAYHDGEGGRLIRLAWRPFVGRASLCDPVSCEMVYYFNNLKAVQRRLLSEIGPALDQSTRKQSGGQPPSQDGAVRILPFKPRRE